MTVSAGDLQNERDLPERRMPDDARQRIEPDLSLTQVLVVIAAGREGGRGIVQVDQPDPLKQIALPEFGDDLSDFSI